MAEEEELRKLTQVEAETHLEDYKYTDENGEKVNIPAKCAVSQVQGENTLKNGLVIIDANGNEWVWVEVPKTIYTTATSNIDYTNIEKDMQTYARYYINNQYTDTWSSKEQHGFTSSQEYNNYKNNMLKSIYDNEGFYIGRYEAGTYNARSSSSDALEIPIIKRDVYPYNFVTCKQAQILSNQLSVGEKNTSLMFGIQWGLVLKYLETTGVSQNELNNDSKNFGNYRNSTFEINRGKYNRYDEFGIWNDYKKELEGCIVNNIKQATNEVSNTMLLTTGITKQNSEQNIYDLAGNVYEYTLEKTTNPYNEYICTGRGGYFANISMEQPASSYGNFRTTNSSVGAGFRPTLVF